MREGLEELPSHAHMVHKNCSLLFAWEYCVDKQIINTVVYIL